MADSRERESSIQRILKDMKAGFTKDYSLDRGDRHQFFLDKRREEGKNINATKMASMLGTNQMMLRARELMGSLPEAEKRALQENSMGLEGSRSHKAGQLLGTLAGDITQDTTRAIYWLLNAAQATGEVINEASLAKAVPSLYDRSLVTSNRVKGADGKDRPLEMGNKDDLGELLKREILKRESENEYKTAPGFKILNKKGKRYVTADNYRGGAIQSLAIPTGVAINAGMGLLTPGGGYEGYKAVLEDPDDPSKTSNVLGEIAMKYIIGRTGGLLPYEEFKKVRPDVSRAEYNKYQAFKYDKAEDYDPTDGDLSVGAGTLRFTTEGIHGPELQMLGRSLPVTTALIPYAASLAGGIAGAKKGSGMEYTDKYGVKRGKAVRGGFLGGLGGLALGTIAGNIIEDERRRRNSLANQLQGGNAEQYLE